MNEIGADLSRVSRICAVAWRVIQRHRMVGGALVGLSLPVARIVSDLFAVPIADSVELTLLAGLYLIALAALCWPWTSYALALRLSMAAAIALVCVGSVNVFVRNVGATRLVPWIFPVSVVFVFAVFWAAAFAVLSGLVFVRTRNWTVYRPGYCQACGNGLMGLQDARCPECGTPFVPSELNTEGVCGKSSSHGTADRSNLCLGANGPRRVPMVGGDS